MSAVITGDQTGTVGLINLGSAVTCAGQTSIPYSIPSGVKRITVILYGVSTSGSSNVQIQLGTGATPTYATSGYVCQTAVTSTSGANASGNYTSGIVFGGGAAANILTGQVIFTNPSGNNWVATGSAFLSSTAMLTTVGGVALGDLITAIRVTTINGTDTFDTTPSAGLINILYE